MLGYDFGGVGRGEGGGDHGVGWQTGGCAGGAQPAQPGRGRTGVPRRRRRRAAGACAGFHPPYARARLPGDFAPFALS